MYIGEADFLGVKILNIRIFFGCSENISILGCVCMFMVIFWGSLLKLATFMGYFKQNLTFLWKFIRIFLGMLEILGNFLVWSVRPAILGCLGSDTGASPMYMQKLRVPPLDRATTFRV